jgi:Flp pilus assembly protein TadD
MRVVRVQAAQSLAAYPRNRLSKENLKNLERAEKELLEMYNARPDDWASHYNIGNYRMARGDPKGAMTAYQESIKLRPDVALPCVNAAVLAAQQSNIQQAIQYLRQAVQAEPQHGAANLNLGMALAETGDLIGAEKCLRIAMQDPACRAQAAFNCAVIVGQRDPVAARDLSRIAMETEPANTRYRDAYRYYSEKL